MDLICCPDLSTSYDLSTCSVERIHYERLCVYKNVYKRLDRRKYCVVNSDHCEPSCRQDDRGEA